MTDIVRTPKLLWLTPSNSYAVMPRPTTNASSIIEFLHLLRRLFLPHPALQFVLPLSSYPYVRSFEVRSQPLPRTLEAEAQKVPNFRQIVGDFCPKVPHFWKQLPNFSHTLLLSLGKIVSVATILDISPSDMHVLTIFLLFKFTVKGRK